MTMRPGRLGRVALAVLALGVTDAALHVRALEGRVRTARAAGGLAPVRTACEGDRAPLADALFYELRGGAFPGSGRPDVAVHVPPGFDGTRRPGLIVYFHGWNGCVASALASDDTACTAGGPPRTAADLSRQIDDAGVNALLVAVELRPDLPTGEPGQMAMPGGFRAMLRELLEEHLADPLGCKLELEALDRVVVISHSGGYQAVASVLELGDVPQISEVDLLDSLYGAERVFAEWMRADVARFDPRVDDALRFVDLYTCCGGTRDRSRSMASLARSALQEAGLGDVVYDDDGVDDLVEAALLSPVVFKRVPREHAALPGAYVRALVDAAGFAHVR
jgi:hypothetical protein